MQISISETGVNAIGNQESRITPMGFFEMLDIPETLTALAIERLFKKWEEALEDE